MGLRHIFRKVRDGLTERPHHLLAISDLHLGCDLKAGRRAGEPKRKSFDGQLAAFLDYYATHRAQGKPWRLILNGDIVDFVAITQTPEPGEAVPFEISPEEREFGLAAEEQKCVWKLGRVFDRHPEVFDALARFLLRGNSVHIIRGNHDAEFHWPAVQREFSRRLLDRLTVSKGRRAYLERQVEFHAWFYLEPGFFYAEHGNAYDSYSLQAGFFQEPGTQAPASVLPVPERRAMELPLSSQVLRYFVNRYAEQVELDDADTWGLKEYLAWVWKAGNPLRIAADYFVMVFRVLYPIVRQSLRMSRAFARAADRAMARVDDQAAGAHVRALLGRFASSEKQALQLMKLVSRPAERSLFDSMQLFYMDRMLLAVASLLTAWGAVGMVDGIWAKWSILAGVGMMFAAANLALGRQRHTDAHPMLLAAARRVAAIFAVRTVVMGHSHRAVTEQVATRSHYFNLGSWTNARGGEGFPHLVVDEQGAELRRWKGGTLAVVRPVAPAPPANPTPTSVEPVAGGMALGEPALAVG